DHIVLGCTHYPFLLKTIRKVIQNRDVRVVDSTEAVAKRTEELLGNASMLQDENQTPTFKFLSLLDDHYVEKLKAKAGI
ncbi:MAG: aspartate/glutamate racemase family protein, partial [Alistipes sp.]|nr:aspartate/glutamate racemase family protein [Candidatus Alistipes equi]